MTDAALFATGGAQPRNPLREGLLLGVVAAATIGMAAFSGGKPVLVALPVLVVSITWAVFKAPLRWTLSALLVVWLSVDVKSDGENLWHTPFFMLNEFFVTNLGDIIGMPAIKVNGLEIVVLLLLGLMLHRKSTGSPIDRIGQVQTAGVVGDFLLLSLAALVFVCANGLLKGAPAAVLIWHSRPALAYLLLVLIFQAGFRGPRDHVVVGRIVVFAACVKSCLAWYVWNVVRLSSPERQRIEYATNHWDSILFTMACVILLTNLSEKFDRRRLALCGLLLPILFVGMTSNNRRLAWVELVMACLMVVLVSPWHAWKRSLVRFVLVSIPIALVYLAAGWTSTSSVFAPVRCCARSRTAAQIGRRWTATSRTGTWCSPCALIPCWAEDSDRNIRSSSRGTTSRRLFPCTARCPTTASSAGCCSVG